MHKMHNMNAPERVICVYLLPRSNTLPPHVLRARAPTTPAAFEDYSS